MGPATHEDWLMVVLLEVLVALGLVGLLVSYFFRGRREAERRWYILLGGGAAALLAAIAIGTQEGMRGFGIVLLVATVALYGLNEFLGRRMTEPLVSRGIDVERLRVE